MTWYPYVGPVPPDAVWSGGIAPTVLAVAGLVGCAALLAFALRAHLHAAGHVSAAPSHHKPGALPQPTA
jgi:hypothetical protein